MTNLKEFVYVKEAADFLGVSSMTLRNWDQSGKLVSTRHPINGYRLYKRSELEKILILINKAPEKKQVKHV